MTDLPMADLAELTGDIARHLGEDWAVLAASPDVDGRDLLREDGALLRIRFTSPRSRWSVTILGVFPGTFHDRPLDQPMPQIRAATNRGPRAIAGDINRRLLPTYLPALSRVRRVRRFQQEQAAAAAARDRVAARIQRLLPDVSCTATPPGSHDLTLEWRRSGEPREATVKLRDTAETADLQLTGIPADTAVRICQLLSPTPRADVQVEDDFPPRWSVTLTRSQDGTPLLELLTPTGGGADHDENDVPYVRCYVNDGEVHEHMSPDARRWRDDPPGCDPAPELDSEEDRPCTA